jgi:hypothetical protein
VVQAEPRRHDADPRALAAAFPLMHGAWGAGFLVSVAEDALGISSSAGQVNDRP